MRTSKPFSMISYNTRPFLVEKLNELKEGGLVQFWAFVEHLPEDDEKKPHKHLYIIPAKLIDTQRIEKALLELDQNNLLGKPLGAIFPRSSKFDDWYLYALHDQRYLALKGQKRKYHYNDDSITVSCEDTFRELKSLIDYTAINRMSLIIEKAENGESLAEIIKSCNIPLQLIGQVKQLYDIITSNFSVYRGSRKTHTPKIDTTDDIINMETGEVIKAIEKNLNDTERPTFKPACAEDFKEINKLFK